MFSLTLPKLSLGRLRAKLAERRAAKAAKKTQANRENKNERGCPSWSYDILKSSSTVSIQSHEPVIIKRTETSSPLQLAGNTTNTGMTVSATISDMLRAQLERCDRLKQETGPQIKYEEANEMDFDLLPEAWFRRRTSSLMRIGASNMRIIQEVRSPRPARLLEYGPLILSDRSVMSDGVEVEMDDMAEDGSFFDEDYLSDNEDEMFEEQSTFDTGYLGDDEDEMSDMDDFSIVSLQPDSSLRIHNAIPTWFRPVKPRTNTITYASSIQELNEDTAGSISSTSQDRAPRHNRPRPAPLTLRTQALPNTTKPVPVQGQFCAISETPLSFQDVSGYWPETPKQTIVVFRPGTLYREMGGVWPGTAHTFGSERLLFDEW